MSDRAMDETGGAPRTRDDRPPRAPLRRALGARAGGREKLVLVILDPHGGVPRRGRRAAAGFFDGTEPTVLRVRPRALPPQPEKET
jgi:hypothetical protein